MKKSFLASGIALCYLTLTVSAGHAQEPKDDKGPTPPYQIDESTASPDGKFAVAWDFTGADKRQWDAYQAGDFSTDEFMQLLGLKEMPHVLVDIRSGMKIGGDPLPSISRPGREELVIRWSPDSTLLTVTGRYRTVSTVSIAYRLEDGEVRKTGDLHSSAVQLASDLIHQNGMERELFDAYWLSVDSLANDGRFVVDLSAGGLDGGPSLQLAGVLPREPSDRVVWKTVSFNYTSPRADRLISSTRIGGITPTTTREDLDELFGPENLDDARINIGEGTNAPGVRIFADTDDHIDVVWASDGKLPALVICHGSNWKTEHSLGRGTHLASVEEANGVPFELAPFETDGEGRVISWREGKLPESIEMQFAFGNRLREKEFQDYVFGDGPPEDGSIRRFLSSDAPLRQMEPTVFRIWVEWAEPAYE